MTRTRTFFQTNFLALLLCLSWTGCAENSTRLTGPESHSSPPAAGKMALTSHSQADLILLVTNADVPAVGLQIAITPSISGIASSAVQTKTTDASGQAQFSIALSNGKAGYYEIKATNSAGQTVGQWSSIPVNPGETYISLPVGGNRRPRWPTSA